LHKFGTLELNNRHSKQTPRFDRDNASIIFVSMTVKIAGGLQLTRQAAGAIAQGWSLMVGPCH
jgi:hypothetical protein